MSNTEHTEHTEHTKLDFDQAYRVEGWSGIAWRVTSYEVTTDEDFEWTGLHNTNYDRVVCHMIGDDRDFIFDVDDLTALEDGEYCSGCGQIGCGWC